MQTMTKSEPLLSISAVERDTGISKDTLRVWERRYGFPQPERDPHGDRRYSGHQVEKLKVIRRLLEQGFRPGKIIAATLPELVELAGGQDRSPHAASADADGILKLLRAHDVDPLRLRLQQLLVRQGLERFVLDTIAPLNVLIGQAWMRGDLAVFEEHLYSELAESILRNAILSVATPGSTPRVLLATLPGEEHGLGLLMAEALLALAGANCVALGTQIPAIEVASAARAHTVDVVALSFSGAFGARDARNSLQEIRARLPLAVELWAGGGAVLGMRRAPDGVRIVRTLAGIGEAVSEWRERGHRRPS